MNDKYEKQIFKSPWKEIKEHALRDGIIIVDASIPLAIAAQAVVENDTEKVGAWIKANEFGKPSEEQLQLWKEHEDKPFLFFIAQPYVLIQEITMQ